MITGKLLYTFRNVYGRWIILFLLLLLLSTKAVVGREQCGMVYQRQAFVTGGSATSHSWPWIVSIRDSSHFRLKHFCAGVLISPQLVLTAAHCMYRLTANKRKSRHLKDIFVAVGARKLTERVRGEQWIKVIKIYLHPSFDASSLEAFHNDLAILQLHHAASKSDRKIGRSVCLPKRNERSLPGQQCIVTGWGHDIDLQQKVTESMRQAVIPIISKKVCQRKNQWFNLVDNSMLCAGLIGSKKKKRGACAGDSGGPLLCSGNGHKWSVQGVVSWGAAICLSKPTVFADVAFMRPWIDSVLQSKNLLSRQNKKSLKKTDFHLRRSECPHAQWELVRRLRVLIQPLLNTNHFHISLQHCVTQCCLTDNCVAVQYMVHVRRCTFLSQTICSISSRQIIYPTTRLILYVGIKCH